MTNVSEMASRYQTSEEITDASLTHDDTVSFNFFGSADSESAMPTVSLASPMSMGRTSKQGPARDEWDAMRSDIKRLYIEEGRTLKETRFILSLVYHFHPYASARSFDSHLKKWNLTKNGTRGRQGRKVPQASSDARTQSAARGETSVEETLFEILQARIAMPLVIKSGETFQVQEGLLHSIHDLVFGMFQSHSWDAGKFSLTPPQGVESLNEVWQSISRQAFGAGVLVTESKMNQAGHSFREIFALLTTALSSPDPAMVARFWRISRYLYNICFHMNDWWLLEFFFNHARALVHHDQRFQPLHPLARLLNALATVDRASLYDTLRIGYLRSIRCLVPFLSPSHPILLDMWSNYIKEWDPDSAGQANLIHNYQHLLREADREFGANSTTSLGVLHRFTYAAFYNPQNQDWVKSYELATELLQRSTAILPQTPSTWQFSPMIGSFAFAAKVLAILEARQLHAVETQWYYETAILSLQQGDRECRTRALMLARELGNQLEQWNDYEGAERLRKWQVELTAALLEIGGTE